MKIRFIATTSAQRSKGLMFSTPLDREEVAIFLFDHATSAGFWNKNVSFPINVVFLDEQKQIINTENLKAEQVTSVYPLRPYKYVVETYPMEITQHMIDEIMSTIPSKAEQTFNKIAANMKYKKQNEMSSDDKAAIGLTAVGGGGYLAKHQYDRGNITGRERVYHNTETKNVKSILEEGIQSRHASDPKNLTNTVVSDVAASEKEGLTYLSRSKRVADGVGTARSTNRVAASNSTLKGRVPLWKMQIVENPELRGAKNGNEFARLLLKKQNMNYDELSPLLKGIADMQGNAGYKGLGPKNTIPVKGDIDAKFLTKSKKYEKAGLKEVTEFAKANKGRFAKGVGLAALGIGAAAYGASTLFNSESN